MLGRRTVKVFWIAPIFLDSLPQCPVSVSEDKHDCNCPNQTPEHQSGQECDSQGSSGVAPHLLFLQPQQTPSGSPKLSGSSGIGERRFDTGVVLSLIHI